jgi:hypothetical protein
MTFLDWLALIARKQWRLLVTAALAVIVWAIFDEMFPNLPPLKLRDVILLLLAAYAVTWAGTVIYIVGRWAVLKIRKTCGC